jgi:Arc/MetJ-type ribon-helix-helix transcriptional regulator
MTKERISATIDKDTLKVIDELMQNSKYRNKSHVIETAICLLKEKEQSNTSKQK